MKLSWPVMGWLKRGLCGRIGCHFRLRWGLQMGTPQWYLSCPWCGNWQCVPESRTDPAFGGSRARKRSRS